MEDKIKEVVDEALRRLGYEAVKLTYIGGSRPVLEVRIDRIDGQKVSIADCREVSKNLSAILDVEDIIKDKYYLEVASAGLERPLVKLEDYTRFIGREVKIKLSEPHNGKLTFKGVIKGVEGGSILLGSKNVILNFLYRNIKAANLVVTDEMFKELLKSSNKK